MSSKYQCNSCNKIDRLHECLCYLCNEYVYVCDNCQTLLSQNMYHVKLVVERTLHFRENHMSVDIV